PGCWRCRRDGCSCSASPPPGPGAAAGRRWFPMAAERRKNVPRRLLELWGAHARLSWLWMTRDARHCLTWVFADLISAVASVSGVLLLAERFQGIGHWSRWEVLFML